MAEYSLHKRPCGCVIHWSGDGSFIEYCPKHAAAPDLHEALKALNKYRNAFNDVLGFKISTMIRKALAKAEDMK